jgi:hypothetical protein
MELSLQAAGRLQQVHRQPGELAGDRRPGQELRRSCSARTWYFRPVLTQNLLAARRFLASLAHPGEGFDPKALVIDLGTDVP